MKTLESAKAISITVACIYSAERYCRLARGSLLKIFDRKYHPDHGKCLIFHSVCFTSHPTPTNICNLNSFWSKYNEMERLHDPLWRRYWNDSLKPPSGACIGDFSYYVRFVLPGRTRRQDQIGWPLFFTCVSALYHEVSIASFKSRTMYMKWLYSLHTKLAICPFLVFVFMFVCLLFFVVFCCFFVLFFGAFLLSYSLDKCPRAWNTFPTYNFCSYIRCWSIGGSEWDPSVNVSGSIHFTPGEMMSW